MNIKLRALRAQPYSVEGNEGIVFSAPLAKLIETGTAEEFYTEIVGDCDKRHICGVAPIYIMKSVLTDVKGKLIDYAQCPASEDGTSQVSICGMIF